MVLVHWLTDPFAEPFMQRALIEVLVMGVVTGVLGAFVVVRGLAFIGDALSHAIFPGVVTAYLLGQSILLGGAVCGVLTALGIGVVARDRRLGENTAIGVVFAGAFALGVVLISAQRTYTKDLSSFLFGDVLGIAPSDLWLAVALGILVLATVALFYKELVLNTFDPLMAAAAGYSSFALDLLLLGLLTVTIIVALPAVGNILVLAMLVTPAATARLLIHRFGTMILLSAAIAVLAGVLGLSLAYRLNAATGGTIVLAATALFALTLAVVTWKEKDHGPSAPSEHLSVHGL